jgi:hypothetical protein
LLARLCKPFADRRPRTAPNDRDRRQPTPVVRVGCGLPSSRPVTPDRIKSTSRAQTTRVRVAASQAARRTRKCEETGYRLIAIFM